MEIPCVQTLLVLQLFVLLQCHASDRLALLSFKASVVDDPLEALVSWNDSSTDYCLWSGVTCSRRHSLRVTMLDLDSFDIAGSIPPSIANLSFLQRLSIPNNRLNGHIPPELGGLRRLRYLNLSSNSLEGVIPTTLSQCPQLQVISLRSNKLEGGIPYNLSNCFNLKVITLKNNQLIGEIPAAFGNLPNLIYVDVASNNLTGIIPSSLGNISSLIALEVYENSISGIIPPSLSRLTSLVFLRLYENNLTGSIPSSFSNLSSLQYFELAYNSLTGELPSSLGNLSSLALLNVSKNSLFGNIPQSLGDLYSLTTLALTANNFSGSIPPTLGFLSSLSLLALSHNQLSGDVPPTIYNLSTIEYLGVANNKLVGSLPQEFGQYFPRLQSLYMYFNNFHGRIPESLTNATGLQDIELTGNNFTGRIPSNLGTLQDLYWLSLDWNQLKAGDEAGWSFFSSLTNCSRLQVLALEQNGLGGALPRSLGNLSRTLEWLTIGGNQLSGIIPAEIGNLASLTILGLNRNALEGRIPVSIGKLQRLNTLDLSFNKLSGPIPGSFSKQRELSLLNLKFNALEGKIPASLGDCQALEALDLSDNKLTGPIPGEVLSLSSLSKYLDLSNNSLSGSLPLEVGRLRNLRALYVELNNLTGVIPGSIGECEVLEILHMNYNNFQELIPHSMSNLKGMQELNLARNNLSGPVPEFLEGLRFLQYMNLSFNNFEGRVPNKGVFQNMSALSLQGNDKLCGGDPKLNLSACNLETHAKRDQSQRFKIVLSVAIVALFVLLLICLLAFWYWMHNRRNTALIDSMEVQHAKVSYFDILKATDGFSSANLIGVGGHGSVYKAILEFGEEKVVAVKVLNLQHRGALKSFTAECNALKAIRHRNLIKILTTCSSVDNKGNDFKALIFQYMPNGSLEKWLHPENIEQHQRSRLSLLQRINIAIDVASALDYLHHHGSTPVVHCDLKPSNILLDEDMTAHVSDFGLAKFLGTVESKSSQSSSVGVKGTVGYAAPEYGMANQISVKGDIYSYGLLLLEMFTGKRPTDESLKEGLTLHRLVEMALPEQAMDIINPCLLSEGSGVVDARRLQESLITALQIGLSCSKELPKERMEIRLVLKELQAIKDTLVNPSR